jgi:MraZ protein
VAQIFLSTNNINLLLLTSWNLRLRIDSGGKKWEKVGDNPTHRTLICKDKMFIGEYSHTTDEKGRLSVPVKFRADLAAGCVLTRGLDGCLWLYSTSEWSKIAESVSALPITQKNARSFSRFILSGAMDLKLDKIGRINIPKYLSDYASLKGKVIITGMHNRLEIWSEESWSKFKIEMEENSDEVAENLEQIGL